LHGKLRDRPRFGLRLEFRWLLDEQQFVLVE
jgi:hypothetical protein